MHQRTMRELRADIRDKVPELLVRLEMEGVAMGIGPLHLPGETDDDRDAMYDRETNERCEHVLLACDALRQWVYEDIDDESYCIYGAWDKGTLPAWLNAHDRLGEGREEELDNEIDHALEDFPSEVVECNRLLVPILAAAQAKGLDDDELFEYTWLMLSPFLTGRVPAPTDADWRVLQAKLARQRAVKVDQDRQQTRQMLAALIRGGFADDREYTVTLLRTLLAEVDAERKGQER